MHLYRLPLATLALIATFCLPSSAQAPSPPQPWTQVGALVCKVDPNVGFIFVGHQPMQCTYTPSLAPAPPEYYDGPINTVGIDIGMSAEMFKTVTRAPLRPFAQRLFVPS